MEGGKSDDNDCVEALFKKGNKKKKVSFLWILIPLLLFFLLGLIGGIIVGLLLYKRSKNKKNPKKKENVCSTISGNNEMKLDSNSDHPDKSRNSSRSKRFELKSNRKEDGLKNSKEVDDFSFEMFCSSSLFDLESSQLKKTKKRKKRSLYKDKEVDKYMNNKDVSSQLGRLRALRSNKEFGLSHKSNESETNALRNKKKKKLFSESRKSTREESLEIDFSNIYTLSTSTEETESVEDPSSISKRIKKPIQIERPKPLEVGTKRIRMKNESKRSWRDESELRFGNSGSSNEGEWKKKQEKKIENNLFPNPFQKKSRSERMSSSTNLYEQSIITSKSNVKFVKKSDSTFM